MKVEIKVQCSNNKQDITIGNIDITQLIEKSVLKQLNALMALKELLPSESRESPKPDLG